MLTRILTALIIIAVVLPPFIFGGYLMKALVLACILMTSYEVSALPEGKPDWVQTIIMSAFVFGCDYVPASYLPAAAAGALVLLFTASYLNESFTTERAVYTYVIGSITLMASRCIFRLYGGANAFFPMMFIALACYVCDTGAYFFGVYLGKHKMIPRISPNKTWEGAIGGYAAGVIVSLLFGIFAMKQYPLSFLIVAACTLPAVAEIGDLAFSSVKRHFGIKDFGSFLPGHGGALDRLDSLLFCLMFFNGLLICWGI